MVPGLMGCKDHNPFLFRYKGPLLAADSEDSGLGRYPRQSDVRDATCIDNPVRTDCCRAHMARPEYSVCGVGRHSDSTCADRSRQARLGATYDRVVWYDAHARDYQSVEHKDPSKSEYIRSWCDEVRIRIDLFQAYRAHYEKRYSYGCCGGDNTDRNDTPAHADRFLACIALSCHQDIEPLDLEVSPI